MSWLAQCWSHHKKSALQISANPHGHWVFAGSGGCAISRESSNQNLIPGSFVDGRVP